MKALPLLSIFSFLLLIYSQNILSIEEKNIVVVVPSYNNKDWYEWNLTSILAQEYTNYTVKYYNDNSNDGTKEFVQSFISKYDTSHRITLINNPERQGALFNHWQAVHSSPDSAIIVHLDGDDAFPHSQVLKKVNEVYQDLTIWMTYGQYAEYPSGKVGHCKPIPNHIINNNQWRSIGMPNPISHLRTFYASLFKEIKLQDLMYQADFFKVCCDLAFMFPCLEMAGHHIRFIPEVLYLYNTDTPLNNFKIRLKLQLNCFQALRQRSRYQPLDQLPHLIEKYEPYTADLIVFSYNRPLQLYAFLESLEKYITDIERVSVLYRSDNEQFERAYREVEQDFPYVEFVHQSSEQPQADFKQKTIELFFKGTSNYILFAVDDIVAKDYITIKDCIKAMEKTHAYGFYLRLGKNLEHAYITLENPHITNAHQRVPPCIEIAPGTFAWQFKYAEKNWRYPNTLDMTLYRKKDIQDAILNLQYTSPSRLEGNWFIFEYLDFDKVGLCYETTKIVNLPLNKVQKDINMRAMNIYSPETLLEAFNNNLKMDIKPLYKVDNKSAHMEYEPTFIER